jgi:hypothetical protein
MRIYGGVKFSYSILQVAVSDEFSTVEITKCYFNTPFTVSSLVGYKYRKCICFIMDLFFKTAEIDGVKE